MTSLLLAAMVAFAPWTRDAGVRVYVYTATSASGQHTDEEKGRLEAVGEVRDALRRKKGLTIVEDRPRAQVEVEITSREQREPPQGGFGGKMLTGLGDFIIRVNVSAGGERSELKGLGQGNWGRAAKDAADRILKWLARHEPKKDG